MAITSIERDLVEAAARDPYDQDVGLDIVSFGLVYGIHKVDNELIVDIMLTTPGCPVSVGLFEEAGAAVADAIKALERRSQDRVVWDPPWSV